MSEGIKWPTREEWAQRYPVSYWDWDDGCPFKDKYSHRLSDYATAEEIATVSAALKELYRDLGHKLKAANLRVKPANLQQKGEGGAAWYQRFKRLPETDKRAFWDAKGLQRERSTISEVLKIIAKDKIPDHMPTSSYVPGKAGELVKPFNDRYQAAYEVAAEAYVREYAATHVPDDAAWEKEQKRRRDIEQWRRDLRNLGAR